MPDNKISGPGGDIVDPPSWISFEQSEIQLTFRLCTHPPVKVGMKPWYTAPCSVVGPTVVQVQHALHSQSGRLCHFGIGRRLHTQPRAQRIFANIAVELQRLPPASMMVRGDGWLPFHVVDRNPQVFASPELRKGSVDGRMLSIVPVH